MGVGLPPLEFTDCVTDSPKFRDKVHVHEKELEKTNQQIKGLIKDLKDLLHAAKNLSRAQSTLSQSLQNFKIECIGTTQTDDEVVISKSLEEFGKLIQGIEEERSRMMENAFGQIISPLENFRKKHIGGVKEGKKKFEKQTSKFCQSQERYLNLSTKKQDTFLQEADATLEMEQRHFIQASLEYVFLLQKVQERKKFEFVEILLTFMIGWLTFYHQGHEVAKDFKPYMTELQMRIQKTRDNFIATRDETESLMKRTMEMRQTKPLDAGNTYKKMSREGYLFLMEKKAFGTTWTKQYCEYAKPDKEFRMTPYNQMVGKFNTAEMMILHLASCVRRMSDSIEKRFCFDLTSIDKPGIIFTLQALSEEDRKQWLDIMDGKEPNYCTPAPVKSHKVEENDIVDEGSLVFLTKCIEIIETRGLEEQGLYRVVGVNSKVNKLLSLASDKKKWDKLTLDDPCEWESKTITSAIKTYLRTLSEPIMTFSLHSKFIIAAKLENYVQRVDEIHILVHKLPKSNFNVLEILMNHLHKVAGHCDKNLMTVSNLAVCFGPTLLRPEEETVAAIMDIKFCNVVIEILIQNFVKIFKSSPALVSETVEVNHLEGDHGSRQKNHFQPVTHNINKGYYENTQGLSVNSFRDSKSTNLSLESSTLSKYSEESVASVSPCRQQQTFINNFPSTPGLYHTSGSPDGIENNSSSSSSESASSLSHDAVTNLSQIPSKYKRSPLSKATTGTVIRPQENIRVRTLYACLGENQGELTFEPNQIITNVKKSVEPGWLEGTLNGKTGLIPENYVEILP